MNCSPRSQELNKSLVTWERGQAQTVMPMWLSMPHGTGQPSGDGSCLGAVNRDKITLKKPQPRDAAIGLGIQ